MKKYILIGHALGIGGWQLYCDARVRYIMEQGINVYMIYSSMNLKNQTVALDSFTQCPIKNFHELCWPPFDYTKRQTDKIVRNIIDFIDYRIEDEICIESTSILFALWGEMIAKQTNADHLVYILQSYIDNIPLEMKKFFWQKYKQKKLAGMNNDTLRMLFKNYKDIKPEESFGISASWRNPLVESTSHDDLISEIIKNKYIIGYFGSLSKPHFVKICDALTEYFLTHIEDSFSFLSIGSSANGNSELVQKEVEKKCKNCNTYNIKALYPVPKNLFRCMNVCIASWGSANTAARAGTYTIRLMDDENVIPQGIIGVTIRQVPYKDCKICKESLFQLLDNVLYNNTYSDVEYLFPPPQADYHLRQKEEDDILKPFVKDSIDYYDTKNLKFDGTRDNEIKFLNYVFGVRTTLFLNKLVIRRKSAWILIKKLLLTYFGDF